MNFVFRPATLFPRILICLPLLIFVAPSLRAQATDVDRAQLLRTQTDLRPGESLAESGDDQGYAIATPNDPDIGEQQILKRKEQYRPFTFSFGAPFYYTSNVALVREGEEDDLLIAPALTVTYQPRITKTFYAELAVQKQWFYYDEFIELDFASFDAIAGVVYYMPQLHNLTLRARYDYNRLTGTGDFNEFYSEHSLILSAELPFRIGRAQQLSIGLEAQILLESDPDPPGRDDFEAYLGYSVNLTRSFSLIGVGRLAVRNYRVGDRTDVSEIFALSANYRPREWVTLSALSTFAWNQSDQDVFEYSVFNLGGAVAVTFKF